MIHLVNHLVKRAGQRVDREPGERLTETPRRKGRDRTGDIKTSLNSQYTAVGEPAGGG